MTNVIWKRQDGTLQSSYDDDDIYWGYTDTGTAVKWGIVGLILLIIFLWLVGGYYHAQRRLKRNQHPLAYHKFLVPRHQRARFEPQPPFTFYQHQEYGQEYPMHTYPPPAYNAQQPAPPVYQPHDGGSKTVPEQGYSSPPPGPTPSHGNVGESSSAMHNLPLEQGAALHRGQEARPLVQTSKPGFAARMNPFKRGSRS